MLSQSDRHTRGTHKFRQIKNFYVKCYEHVITSTEVVKYLGVHIDKYLNFENIVSNIVSKVNQGVKTIYFQLTSLNIFLIHCLI
jgi:predicted small metal-binding protein